VKAGSDGPLAKRLIIFQEPLNVEYVGLFPHYLFQPDAFIAVFLN
jgi:hypothetical protein